MNTDIAPPGVDLDALTAWMDANCIESGPIDSAVALSGGSQNILVRFRRGTREFVLRRPPLHARARANETIKREIRILGALRGTAVPHPELIVGCMDESVLGGAFYLMAPVDGFNANGGLPPLHAGSAALRHRMGLALVEGIAALAALDHHAIGLADFGRPEGFLERQAPRWGEQLASYRDYVGWPGPDALGDHAPIARWLEENRPKAFTPGLMHGDYHLANVMYRNDGPELAAIVDWELATVGDPLIDLGWLLATWPDADPATTDIAAAIGTTPWDGFPDADELVRYYAAHSTRDLSAMRWYAVLASYKLGIVVEGTHARACAGLAPRDKGDRLHRRARYAFERASRWIA